MNTVVKFLQQNPDRKFTAREIAKWIFETYPDECLQKLKRSTAADIPLDNEKAILQQIVGEIGSQRPRLQKRHPKVKTTEGRPRKYYFTESTDSAEIDHTESHEASPASKVNGSIVKEHDLYTILSDFLWSELEIYSKRIDEKHSRKSRGC